MAPSRDPDHETQGIVAVQSEDLILEQNHEEDTTLCVTRVVPITDENLSKSALSAFKGQSTVKLQMNCEAAFDILGSLPSHALSAIRNLHLASAYNVGSLNFDDGLGRFIVNKMDCRSITLDVPDDMFAGGYEEYPDDGGEFLWTLHKRIISAFKRGRFAEVRFAHPRSYHNWNVAGHSVFSYHIVQSRLEPWLLEEDHADQYRALKDRESFILRKFYASPGPRDAYQDDKDKELYGPALETWTKAGYTLGFDDPRVDEEGTVLVLRQVATAREGILNSALERRYPWNQVSDTRRKRRWEPSHEE